MSQDREASAQRDLESKIQQDRAYVKQLGQLALATSLNLPVPQHNNIVSPSVPGPNSSQMSGQPNHLTNAAARSPNSTYSNPLEVFQKVLVLGGNNSNTNSSSIPNGGIRRTSSPFHVRSSSTSGNNNQAHGVGSHSSQGNVMNISTSSNNSDGHIRSQSQSNDNSGPKSIRSPPPSGSNAALPPSHPQSTHNQIREGHYSTKSIYSPISSPPHQHLLPQTTSPSHQHLLPQTTLPTSNYYHGQVPATGSLNRGSVFMYHQQQSHHHQQPMSMISLDQNSGNKPNLGMMNANFLYHAGSGPAAGGTLKLRRHESLSDKHTAIYTGRPSSVYATPSGALMTTTGVGLGDLSQSPVSTSSYAHQAQIGSISVSSGTASTKNNGTPTQTNNSTNNSNAKHQMTNSSNINNSSSGVNSGSDSLTKRQQHQYTAAMKIDTLEKDNESLHKKCAELAELHKRAISGMEMAQQDLMRMRMDFDEMRIQCTKTLDEKKTYQEQAHVLAAQCDTLLREREDFQKMLNKVQNQRDDAMKEVNANMNYRVYATREMTRLTEEKNAAVTEYALIMSERDSVHKEIEKLQEELQLAHNKNRCLEEEEKTNLDEIEGLKREVTSALLERDSFLKECKDLRDKCGEYMTLMNANTTSPLSPSNKSSSFNFWGSSSSSLWAHGPGIIHGSKTSASDLAKIRHLSASNSSSVSTLSHNNHHTPHGLHHGAILSRRKLGTTTKEHLEQANMEIESLKRQIDDLTLKLAEALQEVEVCKRRRDWAFTERDKIVLESASVRQLCDRLRRERDRAMSDLAQALRDSDDTKKQLDETLKQINTTRKENQSHEDDSSRRNSRFEVNNNANNGGINQGGTSSSNNTSSTDSAIDNDPQSSSSTPRGQLQVTLLL